MYEQRLSTEADGAGALTPVRGAFRALSETFVPEIVGMDGPSWERSFQIVETALRSWPRAVQRQVALLVRALDWISLIRHGRRLAKLEPERRLRFMESLQRSRLLLLRRGIWGLRSLVFMGYYAQPEIHAELGYRARPEGWEAVR
jgi:hypothetical protein